MSNIEENNSNEFVPMKRDDTDEDVIPFDGNNISILGQNPVKSFGQKIFGFFIKGLLMVAPLGVSIYLILKCITIVDGLLNIAVLKAIPGVGFVIVITSITLIGVLANYFITDSITNWFKYVLNKIPMFNLIYTSVHDFMESIIGEKKKFSSPVLVKMDSGLGRLGFVTEDNLEKFGLENEVGVYFPNSYSVMGEYYIVPLSRIKKLDISSAEIMKHIISGGVSNL